MQLREEHGLKAEDIDSVSIRVHSLVLELTGKKAPRTGLEAKFSVYHACAAGILRGQAGEDEFSDEMVARADVIALRDRVRATVDPAITEAAADVTVICKDGRSLHLFVAQAIGSMERPMTDADLARKFHGLVDPVLGVAPATALLEQCEGLSKCADLRSLTALACGAPQRRSPG